MTRSKRDRPRRDPTPALALPGRKAAILKMFLEGLEDTEREIYHCRFEYELTYREIGYRMGISESTARRRVGWIELTLARFVADGHFPWEE